MKTYTINGFYGNNTPCEVFVYELHSGKRFYVVDGSVNVNKTFDDIIEGTNVETLEDIDTFTSSFPICSLEDLVLAVEN